MGGLFLAWTSLIPLENPLRMITIIVCCGTCSGVVGRNSGTPVFARSSVMLWLTPAALLALFLGPWNQLFALLVAIYGLVMCNMIDRLHSDLLNTVTVQRTNAALVAHFDAALSNMSQGLLLYDAAGALRVVNRRFFSLFGLADGTVTTGQYASDVLHACRPNLRRLDRRNGYADSLEGWAAGGQHADHIELTDGRIIAVLPGLLADGGQIVTYEDVSERVRSQARIAHMARHDALTDLPNRVLFHERAEEAIAWLGRGEPFAVAYFDLNKFKSVNDALGHGVGDELLQHVAQRLRACVREVDLAARLGGDEFAIVLPGLRDENEAELLTKRLTNTLSAPYLIADHEVCIGVSIGWALAPRDGATVDALMTQADQGMYAAKAASRSGARDDH